MEAWRQGAIEIVYHEYTHSIMHLNLHWLPVWLDEGLANFYGYTRFQKDKIYIGAPPPPHELPHGPYIPIETLIGVDQNSPYYHSEDKVHQFYGESWGLVHFLMFGPVWREASASTILPACCNKAWSKRKPSSRSSAISRKWIARLSPT